MADTAENQAFQFAGKPGDLGLLFRQDNAKRSPVRRCLLFCGGVLFVGYGIVGSIVPFLPGTPFLVLGMPMLASASETTRRWMNALDRKLPLKARRLLRNLKVYKPPPHPSLPERMQWMGRVGVTVLLWLSSMLVALTIAAFFSALWVFVAAPRLGMSVPWLG